MGDGNIGFLVFIAVMWIIIKCCSYVCKEAFKDEESTDDGGFMTSRALQPRESVSSEAETPRQPVSTHIPMPMPYSDNYSNGLAQMQSPYPPINPNCPYPPLCPYPVQATPYPPPTSYLPSAPCNSADDLDAPPNYNETIKMFPEMQKQLNQ